MRSGWAPAPCRETSLGSSELHDDEPNGSAAYRGYVVSWARDVGRTSTTSRPRDDMELAQLGSSGVSCGGMLGGLLPAVESRLKVAAPVVASLDFGRPLPEADPFTFFPRITIPVLMLNGRLALFFPPETSQATQAPAHLRRGTSGSSLAAAHQGDAGLVRRVPGSGANHEQSGLVHQLTRRRVVHRPVVRSALRARAVRTRSARSTHRASICFSKRFVRRAPRCCAFTKAVEGRALCLAHRGEF